MKILSCLVLSCLVLSSCTLLLPAIISSRNPASRTKTFTTPHDSVMGQYKTKDQVYAEFGLADRKNPYKDLKTWTYYRSPATFTSSSLSGTSQTSKTDIMVSFDFQGEDVMNWRSRGVDYSYSTRENITITGGFNWYWAIPGFVVDAVVLYFITKKTRTTQ